MAWRKAYFDVLNRLGVDSRCDRKTDGLGGHLVASAAPNYSSLRYAVKHHFAKVHCIASDSAVKYEYTVAIALTIIIVLLLLFDSTSSKDLNTSHVLLGLIIRLPFDC